MTVADDKGFFASFFYKEESHFYFDMPFELSEISSHFATKIKCFMWCFKT